MKFNVKDRIVLLNVLPAEGQLTTIRLLRELREALSFTEVEHVEYKMREDEGRIFWDSDGEKDVPVGPKALAIILDAFDALDKSGKFKDEMLDTYEKFQEVAE